MEHQHCRSLSYKILHINAYYQKDASLNKQLRMEIKSKMMVENYYKDENGHPD